MDFHPWLLRFIKKLSFSEKGLPRREYCQFFMFYKNSASKSLDHSITFLLKILLFYKQPNYISSMNRAYANREAEDFQWNLITRSDLKGNLWEFGKGTSTVGSCTIIMTVYKQSPKNHLRSLWTGKDPYQSWGEGWLWSICRIIWFIFLGTCRIMYKMWPKRKFA